jgi:hypothetical protein
MTEPGTTQSEAIGKWQAKVSADIERWERIRSKEAVSGYTGTHGQDTGIEYVLGQRGQETTQPEAIGSGLTARPGVKTPQHLARSPRHIAPAGLVMLLKHRLKQEHARQLLGKPLVPTDLVFSHPDGRPFRPNSVTRAFKVIAESVGLKGIRLHDLRHAHATIMLQQGIHPKIVQERLGHSSVATTLDIYSHVVAGLQEAAARRFEEGLESALTEAQATEVRQKMSAKCRQDCHYEKYWGII